MRSFGVILLVSASWAAMQSAAPAQPARPEQPVPIDTRLINRLADMMLWSGLENLEALLSLTNEPSLSPGHDAHEPHR